MFVVSVAGFCSEGRVWVCNRVVHLIADSSFDSVVVEESSP